MMGGLLGPTENVNWIETGLRETVTSLKHGTSKHCEWNRENHIVQIQVEDTNI